MSTLKNLVNKGVKVELGVPFELWDEPSVEVADLKRQVIKSAFKVVRLEVFVCIFIKYLVIVQDIITYSRFGVTA